MLKKQVKKVLLATGVVLMCANVYTFNKNLTARLESDLCFDDVEAFGQQNPEDNYSYRVQVQVNLYGSHGGNPNAPYFVDCRYLTRDDIIKYRLTLPNGRLYEIGFVPEGEGGNNRHGYPVWQKCVGTKGLEVANISGEHMENLIKCGKGNGDCYFDQNC